MRWLVCLWLGHASATTLESAFAHRLVRARRAGEVERLRGQFDHARVARLTCDLQNARGTAPTACYLVLATERAWHVIDSAEFHHRLRRLDASCARASLNQRVPDVESVPDHVSPGCRARVREARLNREYQRDDRAWSED